MENEKKAVAIKPKSKVLLVEDNVGEITWLLDFLGGRGYSVDVETNEGAARKRLAAIQRGDVAYAMAIFDIMISVKEFSEIIELSDEFYDESTDSGIRLCQYARTELQISAKDLPIICLSGRDDSELKIALSRLKIPLFDRADLISDKSIRAYIRDSLPVLDE